MKPIEFPQQTMVLAKDQPQYDPFPVYYHKLEQACIGCFELSDKERQDIADGKPLWLWQWTFGKPFQPVALTTENPWPNDTAPREGA